MLLRVPRIQPHLDHERFFVRKVVHGVLRQRFKQPVDAVGTGAVKLVAQGIQHADQTAMLAIHFGKPGFKKGSPFKGVHGRSSLPLLV